MPANVRVNLHEVDDLISCLHFEEPPDTQLHNVPAACPVESNRRTINSVQLISERTHDDVIKWKHFPRYWPFVRGIHRSPVNSPHKGQWRGALIFSLICARINGWVNNHEAGDLRRHRAYYDVIVLICWLRVSSILHIRKHLITDSNFMSSSMQNYRNE